MVIILYYAFIYYLVFITFKNIYSMIVSFHDLTNKYHNNVNHIAISLNKIY